MAIVRARAPEVGELLAQQVVSFVQAVRRSRASVVMVSHDPRHQAICDRVITLVDGRKESDLARAP